MPLVGDVGLEVGFGGPGRHIYYMFSLGRNITPPRPVGQNAIPPLPPIPHADTCEYLWAGAGRDRLQQIWD
jgi:hypothetical protein